jgi:hypothetical protein
MATKIAKKKSEHTFDTKFSFPISTTHAVLIVGNFVPEQIDIHSVNGQHKHLQSVKWAWKVGLYVAMVTFVMKEMDMLHSRGVGGVNLPKFTPNRDIHASSDHLQHSTTLLITTKRLMATAMPKFLLVVHNINNNALALLWKTLRNCFQMYAKYTIHPRERVDYHIFSMYWDVDSLTGTKGCRRNEICCAPLNLVATMKWKEKKVPMNKLYIQSILHRVHCKVLKLEATWFDDPAWCSLQ